MLGAGAQESVESRMRQKMLRDQEKQFARSQKAALQKYEGKLERAESNRLEMEKERKAAKTSVWDMSQWDPNYQGLQGSWKPDPPSDGRQPDGIITQSLWRHHREREQLMGRARRMSGQRETRRTLEPDEASVTEEELEELEPEWLLRFQELFGDVKDDTAPSTVVDEDEQYERRHAHRRHTEHRQLARNLVHAIRGGSTLGAEIRNLLKQSNERRREESYAAMVRKRDEERDRLRKTLEAKAERAEATRSRLAHEKQEYIHASVQANKEKHLLREQRAQAIRDFWVMNTEFKQKQKSREFERQRTQRQDEEKQRQEIIQAKSEARKSKAVDPAPKHKSFHLKNVGKRVLHALNLAHAAEEHELEAIRNFNILDFAKKGTGSALFGDAPASKEAPAKSVKSGGATGRSGSVSKAVFQQRFESPGKRRSRMNRASTDGAVLVAPKQEHGDTRKDATERTIGRLHERLDRAKTEGILLKETPALQRQRTSTWNDGYEMERSMTNPILETVKPPPPITRLGSTVWKEAVNKVKSVNRMVSETERAHQLLADAETQRQGDALDAYIARSGRELQGKIEGMQLMGLERRD